MFKQRFPIERLTKENLLNSEPKTRLELLRHSAAITLDPDTANRRLGLSEDNRKVTLTARSQGYSDHPDRFVGFCCQVLSRESLTSRCYWEVERRGGGVIVAVSEKDISRKGRLRECLFGLNNKSWALYCYEDRYEFRHNNILTPVSGPDSSRLGVFLDHSAGVLSFYSVSPTWTLLHRVQTSFPQPLHAGFTLYYPGDSAEIAAEGSSCAVVSETADELQQRPIDARTAIPERRSKEELLTSKAEPKTRLELLRYSTAVTLDPNTAHRRLGLDEQNRSVILMKGDQPYPDIPDRFLGYYQVLSRESLTGRCYWEVEWRGGVRVAVAYKSIKRDGKSDESSFGFNDKSWALYCNKDSYVFIYNRTSSPVPGPNSSRLGVFLDHSAGVLSFYSVSPTWTLLYRVQTSFTQPLHAGIRLYYPGDAAEIVRLSSKAESQTADIKKKLPRDTKENSPERRTKILLFQPEPKTRLELLQHSAAVTLDPNTANRHLGLSEENRKVTLLREVLRYPDHPHRFMGSCQVLSRESLTGRCYWEVEKGGRGGVNVAVAYKSISRNKWSGENSFGSNDQSWALEFYKGSYVFMYNRTSFPVSGPDSSRLGVFLDHSAGVLAFYSVSPTWTLLHRVQTSFTQPLYAGFTLHGSPGTSAEIVKL